MEDPTWGSLLFSTPSIPVTPSLPWSTHPVVGSVFIFVPRVAVRLSASFGVRGGEWVLSPSLPRTSGCGSRVFSSSVFLLPRSHWVLEVSLSSQTGSPVRSFRKVFSSHWFVHVPPTTPVVRLSSLILTHRSPVRTYTFAPRYLRLKVTQTYFYLLSTSALVR